MSASTPESYMEIWNARIANMINMGHDFLKYLTAPYRKNGKSTTFKMT